MHMMIYGFGGMPVMSLMTSDQTVAEAGREFLPWLLLMPLVGCPAFTWDGIYIGAAATRELRDSTILCAIGFFAFWFAGAALARSGSGSPALFIHILLGAYFVHLLIRSLYQTVLYRKAILARLLAVSMKRCTFVVVCEGDNENDAIKVFQNQRPVGGESACRRG